VSSAPHATYDVSPDGKTFVMVRSSPAARVVVSRIRRDWSVGCGRGIGWVVRRAGPPVDCLWESAAAVVCADYRDSAPA
jgi:hypothetical protein